MTASHPGEAPPLALVLGDPAPAVAERLDLLRGLATFVPVTAVSDAEREAAQILLVWDFRSRSLDEVVRAMPSLRWLHAASAGLEHVLVPAVVSSEIVVTNAAGSFDEPIAEFVAALVLAHSKQLDITLAAQRDHRWLHREAVMVAGSTMVIVGMGRIGRAVGRTARALGMHVTGVRRSGRPHADDPEGTRIETDLAAAAAHADYLVVTAALTPETRNLVSAAVIEALRPTAYVINVARAPIADTGALVAALRDGRLAGAALDVFDREPLLPESELWDVPGLLVTPHMSGDTVGYTAALMDDFGVQLRRWLAGEPLDNVVDPRRGY